MRPVVEQAARALLAGPVEVDDSVAVEPLAAREVQPRQTGNYLRAIAQLVALADWVTVRSQVFTIYGVLRGEGDETLEDENLDEERQARVKAADVNSRAIRFQETVDRLPTFLGKSLPVRIGDRTVGSYLDVRSD